MDKAQTERAKKLVGDLKNAGPQHGLLVNQGAVIMRGPGSPWTDSPMLFATQEDLENAVQIGLLVKSPMIDFDGRSELAQRWEWYVPK